MRRTKNLDEKERFRGTRQDPTIVSAIREQVRLKFFYNGRLRLVEPQTYGRSNTSKEVLRANELGGQGRLGGTNVAKLFDLAKITDLEKSRDQFMGALPAHNPDDSAMIEVFASLPKPKAKRPWKRS